MASQHRRRSRAQSGTAIDPNLKAQADDKRTELQTMLEDTNVTLESVKDCLDSFQQVLFTIGASVYEQSGQISGSPNVSDNNSGAAVQVEHGDEDLGLDDVTMTADYEAVE